SAVEDRDADLAVAQGLSAADIGTEVIALHDVAGPLTGSRPTDAHPAELITRDDVPVAGRCAADGVVVSVDLHAGGIAKARRDRAGGVGAEEVAGDDVVVAVELDPGAVGPVDDQTAYRAVAGDPQGRVIDVAAVQLDERRAREARLRRAVDDHRIGDDVQ